MPTLQIARQIDVDLNEVLSSITKLNAADLEQFLNQVTTILARRKAPNLSQRETDLLQRINEGVPDIVRQRYRQLNAKRQAETLSEPEHSELLSLVDRIELADADRLGCLIELANLRGVTVAALMQQLGIQAPAYA